MLSLQGLTPLVGLKTQKMRIGYFKSTIMKRIAFGLFAIIIFFPSCNHELEPVEQCSEVMSFYASFSNDSSTKTVRQSDGKVFWSPGEDIHIFQGSRQGKFTSQNSEISATASFSGTFNSNTDSGTDYWAIYPWDNDNMFIDWGVYLPIRSTQNAKAGSFEDGVFPSIAKSSSNQLTFYNVCGGIKFRVFNSGIKKIILKGNNNEVIAGSALVSFTAGRPSINSFGSSFSNKESKKIIVSAPNAGTFTPGTYYYFVVPPVTFTNGFTLTFCNSENLEASFSTNNSITISRSKFGVLNDLDKDLVFAEGEEALRIAEKNALIAIYNSLNGDNWDNKTNWLSDSSIDTWAGVTTDGNGFVSSLVLTDSNIEGTLPNELCQLTHLKQIYFIGNISGSIPSNIGNLTELESIYISSSSLSGSLPESICNLSDLTSLIISNSSLTGTLPNDIGNLVNLQTLSLLPFNGEGPLPTSFSNLSNLINLEISGASLTQAFPECILGMNQLATLNLSSCGLTGSIPAGIGSLSNLRRIDLSLNNLTGQIPNGLGLLDHLVFLNLSGNAFTGFPDNLSQCDALEEVYITDNSVSMSFNNDIWASPSMITLDLSNSNIDGTLSSATGTATSLITLNLSRNHFSGTLPSEMASMTSLRSLYINNNEFTGSIPDSFTAFTNLETFVAYNNYMSGSISESVLFSNYFDKWQLTPQYNNGEFTYSLYESTDYSGHKTSSLLHEATVGNGINIVLMGDAFTDKDIANGTYDYAMNLACEALFEVEPFKSFENRFNVYSIKLVSKNGHVFGDTALGIDYEPALGSYGYSRYGSAMDIVNEVIPGFDVEQLTVGVIINNLHNGGACSAYMNGNGSTPYGSGRSTSIIPNKYVDGIDGIRDFKYTVIHEIVGHGFGKLGDEYASYDGSISSGNADLLAMVQNEHGWAMNLSLSNNPDLVPWKKFLDIPAYVNDGTSIFEGGYDCKYGVWRPTNSSIMSCDYSTYPYFNAPSREAIYRRIHLISNGPGWVYNFDDFLLWDAKNLLTP